MYVPYDVRQMQDQEVTVVTECVYQHVRGIDKKKSGLNN